MSEDESAASGSLITDEQTIAARSLPNIPPDILGMAQDGDFVSVNDWMVITQDWHPGVVFMVQQTLTVAYKEHLALLESFLQDENYDKTDGVNKKILATLMLTPAAKDRLKEALAKNEIGEAFRPKQKPTRL